MNIRKRLTGKMYFWDVGGLKIICYIYKSKHINKEQSFFETVKNETFASGN